MAGGEGPVKRPPISVEPGPHECLLSYLVRLSSANYYPSVSWVVQLLNEDSSEMSYAKMSRIGDKLSRHYGIDTKTIEKMLFKPIGKGRSHVDLGPGDNAINVKDLKLRQTKLCPQCLAEYGYAFRAWHFKALVVCPRHKAFLIERCPVCGARNRWDRKQVHLCMNCGSDYRKMRTSAASGRLVEFASLMTNALGAPYKCDTSRIPQEWRKMSAEALINHITALVRYSPDKRERIMPKDIEEWQEAVYAIADCIVDWPYGFVEYLTRLRQKGRLYEVGRASGVKQSFGRFYDRVVNEDTGDRFKRFRDVLEEYVRTDPLQAIATGRGRCLIYNEAERRGKFLTKDEVRKELRISSSRFDQLYENGTLSGHKVACGHPHVYRITRDSVERCKAITRHQEESTLSRQEMLEQLGVTKTVFGHLIAVSEGSTDPSPVIAGRIAPYKVEKELVGSLTRRILSFSRPVSMIELPILPFAQAYQSACKQSGMCGRKFVKHVWNGEVPAREISPDALGFEKFGFCGWDIKLAAGQLEVVIAGLAKFYSVGSTQLKEAIEKRYVSAEPSKLEDLLVPLDELLGEQAAAAQISRKPATRGSG